jgi:hypothetical protein
MSADERLSSQWRESPISGRGGSLQERFSPGVATPPDFRPTHPEQQSGCARPRGRRLVEVPGPRNHQPPAGWLGAAHAIHETAGARGVGCPPGWGDWHRTHPGTPPVFRSARTPTGMLPPSTDVRLTCSSSPRLADVRRTTGVRIGPPSLARAANGGGAARWRRRQRPPSGRGAAVSPEQHGHLHARAHPLSHSPFSPPI